MVPIEQHQRLKNVCMCLLWWCLLLWSLLKECAREADIGGAYKGSKQAAHLAEEWRKPRNYSAIVYDSDGSGDSSKNGAPDSLCLRFMWLVGFRFEFFRADV